MAMKPLVILLNMQKNFGMHIKIIITLFYKIEIYALFNFFRQFFSSDNSKNTTVFLAGDFCLEFINY